MRSIRKTLCRSIVGSLLGLSILTGAAGFLWARHILLDQVDASLMAKAQALANLVEIEKDSIYFEFTDDNMPEFISGNPRHFFQVWSPDGSVLAKSKSLAGDVLPHQAGSLADPVTSVFRTADGAPARAVQFQFDPILEIGEQRFIAKPSEQKASIVVARDTGDINALLTKLFLFILCAVLVLPLLAALLITAAIRRGLRPLDTLSNKVAEVDASSLHTQFSDGDEIAELRPITQRLNDLFSRLETAFEREKRFTTDASHELRTPLAESRTALEIALKWPEDTELLVRSATQALEATQQMESMVAALLELARAESDKAEAPREAVDLRDLVAHCWKNVRWLAAEKTLEMGGGEETYAAFTNRALATAIVSNLLTNAIQHSPPNAIVFCEFASVVPGGIVSLTISNSMENALSSADIKHLFEPLWRKDTARTEAGEADAHFGLGLTLVKAYCDKVCAGVEARLVDGNFVIEVRFPVFDGELEKRVEGGRVAAGV